jgi:nucleotide-binding universal stress UspA family protein
MPFRRVLVPLDGSALAEGVIPLLESIAGPLDLEVTLLRVLQPLPPEIIEGTRHLVIEDVEARFAEARRYLTAIATTLEATGVRVAIDVRRGQPVEEILEGVKAAKADLVAMTTHGRSGLGRLLFGSVAEAVLRHADVPVFLMKLTEKAAAAQAAARLAATAR